MEVTPSSVGDTSKTTVLKLMLIILILLVLLVKPELVNTTNPKPYLPLKDKVT